MHMVLPSQSFTTSSDDSANLPMTQSPGLRVRRPPPRYLPGVLLLVSGALPVLAYLALPWFAKTCPAYLVQVDPAVCPTVGTVVGYWAPGNDVTLNPWLPVYCLPPYFGSALLVILAGVVALAVRRARVVAASGIVLGII